jgi:hypothetical protein
MVLFSFFISFLLILDFGLSLILSKCSLNLPLEQYIKPVCVKNTDIHHNYLIIFVQLKLVVPFLLEKDP